MWTIDGATIDSIPRLDSRPQPTAAITSARSSRRQAGAAKQTTGQSDQLRSQCGSASPGRRQAADRSQRMRQPGDADLETIERTSVFI